MQIIASKKQGSFKVTWRSGNWVSYITDSNQVKGNGAYGFIAEVKDVENNSPQIRIPPEWNVMAGCPAQTLGIILNHTIIEISKTFKIKHL